MNKDLLSKVLLFVSGACVGSVVTWKLIEKKYQQIAQEEINSVKEALGYFDLGEKEDKPEPEDKDNKDDRFDREKKNLPISAESRDMIIMELVKRREKKKWLKTDLM